MSDSCTHSYSDRKFISCEMLGLGTNTYAQIPIPVLNNGRLIAYFTSRDLAGKSVPFVVELDKQTFTPLEKAKPLKYKLGDVGTFDEDGVMPSSILESSAGMSMYYIGWNRGNSTPYRLSIGLANKNKNEDEFSRTSPGPILDRSIENPYFVTTPHVYTHQDKLRMLFSSGTGWVEGQSKQESLYVLKMAESSDGFRWKNFRDIDLGHNTDICLARPFYFDSHIYVSKRNALEFRTQGHGYRIETYNVRREGKFVKCKILWKSDLKEAMDKSYSSLITLNEKRFIFYNGDNFGRNGFHVAEEIIIN